MEILGVKIDGVSLAEALEKINGWISATSGRHLLTTVNPEFIVEAQKNEPFRRVLNSADLAVCDGAGLIWAGKFLQQKKLLRVTGVDLTEKLISNIQYPISNIKIYLLGGREGIAQAVKDKYPEASIVGAESGGQLKAGEWQLENNQTIINQINQSGANILLVAFGQVKQEMWLNQNLPLLSNIKVAIGVGGTFDYLSGQTKRAPLFFRRWGLEWLYRLFKEPQRWRRIWNATVVFSWLVIKEKIFNFQ